MPHLATPTPTPHHAAPRLASPRLASPRLAQNLIRWGAAILEAAEVFDEQIRAETQLHVAVAPLSTYSAVFRAVFVCLAAALAPNGLHAILHTAVVAVGSFVPAVQFAILLFNWWHVFTLYRERVYAMRRGKYFFDRALYREARPPQRRSKTALPPPPPHSSPSLSLSHHTSPHLPHTTHTQPSTR